MELYLIKSAACLAIFFSFYKLFLERESMHLFKRYYLLGSILAAFIIPLITFTSYVDASNPTTSMLLLDSSKEAMVDIGFFEKNLSTILWSIYILGVLFFSLKFGWNLFRMIQKIKKNPLQKERNIFHVLLNNPTTPHTFFSYIFLNIKEYKAQEIPEEVLLHEQAHALQKHSFDVLLIELLQIAFWFNPFIYYIKHSIKLNHEFLADRAVLNNGVDTSNYQNIILAFSSSAASPLLANSINYSFIKKRFTVMKTKTSKTGILFRSVLMLPLLALLLFSFSTREVIEREMEMESVITELIQENATAAQLKTYNDLARKYNAMSKGKRIMKRNELMTMEYIYGIMSKSQKAKAEPFPEFIPPPPPPAPDATKPPPPPKEDRQLIEVIEVKPSNTPKADRQLVEVIEVAPSISPNVIVVDRIHSPKMATKVIELIKVSPRNIAVLPSTESTVTVVELTNGEMAYVVPSVRDKPAIATTVIRESNGQLMEIEVIENQDYLKMIHAKNAIFYFEGKKINVKKAIKVLENNDDVYIRTLDQDSNQPIIKLERHRLIIDRQ
jgi:hypothetical protein